MRNQYSPWEELASMPHIELRREPPGDGRLGEYVHHSSLIRLDPSMHRRQARSVLCHELRHVQFEDVLTADKFINARQEARADDLASRLLVNIYDLGDAMVLHDQRLMSVAVELRVSLDMLQVRLGCITPVERGMLRTRFDNEATPYSF